MEDKKTAEAPDLLARARAVGRWVFAILGVVVVALTIMKIGADNDWAFLGDLNRPFAQVHWDVWRDIVLAVLGGTAAAGAVSFSVRYFMIRNELNQYIETRSKTRIHAPTKIHTTHNHGSDDAALREEIQNLRKQVEDLEELLVEKQSNPAHLRQIQEIMNYAHNERVIKLQAQLARDEELFEKFRGIASSLAVECERGRNESRSVG
ncbi:MAG: hypothetical protein H7124_13545 [Phycisphaerales bacterium]|nr:hypothetical protein [Hyphomonadaceae bacterium]